MEHCVAQELYQFVKQSLAASKPDQRLLPEAEVAVFVRQLAQGIKYMQERGIMHRDLKLSNILVTEEIPRTLKIIDFGLAVQLQDFDEER
jgi:serine/threonine protein kinase